MNNIKPTPAYQVSWIMKIHIQLLILFFVSFSSHAQQTVGLFTRQTGQLDGYILFAPMPSDTTYLIDKCGKRIHHWPSTYHPGLSVYLLEDGSILRTGNTNNSILNYGGSGGIIEKIDWQGNVTWSYTLSSATECQHHDIYPMPNGNILVISWEAFTDDDAIAEGRNPSETNASIWSDKILEIQPTGTNTANIVWEWHAWDHLIQEYDASKNNYGIVADHPELIDINFSATAMNPDWLHINAVHYNPQLDQILLTCHNFHELWIIDHSTTTAEAATHNGGNSGKGGDLLYRWGNPAAYNRGNPGTKKLYGPHNAYWINAGFPDENKIMIYNNGLGCPQGNYSSVEIIEPPIAQDNTYTISTGQAYAPAASSWIYTAVNPTDFFSSNISGAQRLENGNTLICEGAKGKFFELDSDQNIVWEYINPVQLNGPISQGTTPGNNNVFRCTYYAPDYAAFSGRELTPGSPLELNPLNYACEITTDIIATEENTITLFPNPAENILQINFSGDYQLVNAIGQVVLSSTVADDQNSIDISHLSAGMYLIQFQKGNNYTLQRFVKK
ncbi:MAG: hypothetical protein POELPBGB_03095 [Bacteroidia bacterium]|nr:hypothetical protein [Bacteroidia bacterium]